MNVLENIKESFRRGDALVRLIYVNVGVFLLFKLSVVSLTLFNHSGAFLLKWLAVPADLGSLLRHPWTLITYMFLHEGFLHLFFNMLCLYWFGKIFLTGFSERHLVGLYLVGGVGAALLYIAAFNIFPYFDAMVAVGILLGASGSIMAIITAAATKFPNTELRLFLLGGIKLKYIAVIVVLTSFFGITSANEGGKLAHLGGALTGYLFAVLLSRGKDITTCPNRVIDWLTNLFRSRRMRVKKPKNAPQRKMTDAEYNRHKAQTMEEIDRILDKIKASGYDSLSTEEKRKLFSQGKK